MTCVQCKLCNYASINICIYLYCHGFSCWKFVVFDVFLQRKLFNNRTLPSSGRLRELLHCFNRRAGRWWPFTPTLANIIVTCNCTALKWELSYGCCHWVSVNFCESAFEANVGLIWALGEICKSLGWEGPQFSFWQ